MKQKSLFSKISLEIGVIFAISILILSITIGFLIKTNIEDQLKMDMRKVNETISQEISKQSKFNETESIENEKMLNSNIEFLYKDKGYVIYFIEKKYNIQKVFVSEYKNLIDKTLFMNNNEYKLKLESGESVFKKGYLFESEYEDKGYTLYTPIIDENGEMIRIISIFKSSLEFNKRINSLYGIIFIASFFALLIGLCLIYFILDKVIIKPILEINNEAKRLSRGDVSRRIKYNKIEENEITDIAKSFNQIADYLEETDKNKRTFISNVSHELRSPITTIRGFIDAIQDGVVPQERQSHYLNLVQDETKRLTRLVNDLLDLSAMESGNFSMSITDIDIVSVVKLCVSRSDRKINEGKQTCDVICDDSCMYVLGDRDRLMQVVTNLLDNAIKYNSIKGKIKINIKNKGEKVHVSIYNSGSKISEEDLPYIWDRFYKTDKVRTNKISSGLGLSITRNILTQLNEDIWVENVDKMGVRFTFTLTKYKKGR